MVNKSPLNVLRLQPTIGVDVGTAEGVRIGSGVGIGVLDGIGVNVGGLVGTGVNVGGGDGKSVIANEAVASGTMIVVDSISLMVSVVGDGASRVDT